MAFMKLFDICEAPAKHYLKSNDYKVYENIVIYYVIERLLTNGSSPIVRHIV